MQYYLHRHIQLDTNEVLAVMTYRLTPCPNDSAMCS